MFKIKKGDQVQILVGKDKGKKGFVEKIFPKVSLAIVSGVNLYKKHQKARVGKKAAIAEIVKPLPFSNLGFICPKCNNLTRVGFKLTSTGKFRICGKCKAQI